ncbi:GDSL esterase/lipase 5 [Senna tora]|uniref:GDSL esterase/lipase 5 n=1 Tax=Senna tora TaxID=362788 RepID=A0A834XFS6_9FABA|nr:GDSL esterase/lipase 5 [Senna tora]
MMAPLFWFQVSDIPKKAREKGITIMKMDSSRIHSILFFSCASLFLSACFYIKPFLLRSNHSSSAALFVFGSSIFDAGNNNYINTTTSNQANFWPYGETFFRYPTGRFSDGRLISDFIAEYAQLPLILPYLHPSYQSYIHGANFASAGSGALVETNKGLVIDLKTQLSYFINVRARLRQRIGDAKAARLVSKAVYLFNIGDNDYTSIFNSQHNNPHPFINMVISNITHVIKEGKMACCGSGAYRGKNSCGGKRGIKDYELCDNPNEYVFFDYMHLSERANQFFANQMWSGNLSVTWPYNLRTLFEE